MTKSYFNSGEVIRRIRTEIGLQQKDIIRILSDEHGIELSPARYSNYELDNRKIPTFLLIKIAEILGTDSNTLVGVTVKRIEEGEKIDPNVEVIQAYSIQDDNITVKLKKKYPIFSYLQTTGNELIAVHDNPISFELKSLDDNVIKISEKELSEIDKNVRAFVEYELFKISQN